MPNLNLGDIIAPSDVTISPSETPEERAARLGNEKRAKLLEDIKGMVLFSVVLVALLVMAALCAQLIFLDKTATPETQKWAQTALTALLSGGASFLFGRAVAAK